ncbi:hypothetical protein P7L75_25270 [Tistrella mobilis]|uniref:hypothetical protein n=1 Tax=Tistrella mobilis TaxID=171437 RepID=UPI00355686EA
MAFLSRALKWMAPSASGQDKVSELRRVQGAFVVVERADGSTYRTLRPSVRKRVIARAAEVLHEPADMPERS